MQDAGGDTHTHTLARRTRKTRREAETLGRTRVAKMAPTAQEQETPRDGSVRWVGGLGSSDRIQGVQLVSAALNWTQPQVTTLPLSPQVILKSGKAISS